MDEKSGSSGVISSNASSVTFSIYIAGYTLETVLLQEVKKQLQFQFININLSKIDILNVMKTQDTMYLDRVLLAETNQRAYSRRVHKSPG